MAEGLSNGWVWRYPLGFPGYTSGPHDGGAMWCMGNVRDCANQGVFLHLPGRIGNWVALFAGGLKATGRTFDGWTGEDKGGSCKGRISVN